MMVDDGEGMIHKCSAIDTLVLERPVSEESSENVPWLTVSLSPQTGTHTHSTLRKSESSRETALSPHGDASAFASD